MAAQTTRSGASAGSAASSEEEYPVFPLGPRAADPSLALC